MRLDQFLTEQFQISRSRAQLLIKDGAVCVAGKVIKKPSYEIPKQITKESIVVTDTVKHVSRAGLKLEHAITTWGIDIKENKCLDIGSSTGGFTDCLLQYGALHVDCVDVGTDQLHEKIKTDPRVSVFEQTDIRNFQGGAYDIVVADISFISLTAIIPILVRFCHDQTQIVLLIKPQFEVGKEFLNKQGVVKNELIIQECIEIIKNNLIEHGFINRGIIDSPILGGDGNKEFLLYATK